MTIAIGRPAAPTISSSTARLGLFALSALGAIWAIGLFAIIAGPGFDTFAYWRSTQVVDPYTIANGFGAFQYTPGARILFAPLALFSWPLVYWAWLGLSLALVVWMCRRWSLAVLVFVPLVLELFEGNVHVLMAAAIVASFRWPAAWAVVLVTKVTPGIGLLWFVVRGEWRNLAIALLATAVIVVASIAIFGLAEWPGWIRYILDDPTQVSPINLIPISVVFRLPVAIAIVVCGARTNRSWTVPVAAMLALPNLWIYSLAMLVAVIPLWRDRGSSSTAQLRMSAKIE